MPPIRRTQPHPAQYLETFTFLKPHTPPKRADSLFCGKCGEEEREQASGEKHYSGGCQHIAKPYQRRHKSAKSKSAAPNTAEAVPALSRARFMASVVVDVNVSPSEKSMANSSVSYTQNGADSASAANSAAENATISRLP